MFGISAKFHSLLLPNLHACGVSKVKDPCFFFFPHMGQILISRRQKNLPNMAKYKAKLQPRGGCELSKSRAKLLGAILLKGVGKEKE